MTDTFNATKVATSDGWWVDCADRALTWWAQSGMEFTVDDIEILGVPPADHPNRVGALFRSASQRGVIEPVGYRNSTRPSRHGSVIRVWRGKRPA